MEAPQYDVNLPNCLSKLSKLSTIKHFNYMPAEFFLTVKMGVTLIYAIFVCVKI